MFDYLQIVDPWERRIVGAADVVLSVATAPRRLFGRRPATAPPDRVLLLRLERIGDFVMTLPAIAAVSRLAPGASIDLVVGSWNAPLAALVPGLSRILTADAPWLSRIRKADSAMTLARRARGWHRGGYDLAINFEGDIRSQALMAMAGARRRIGFDSGGGGALLTSRATFDPRRHVTANAARLVATAFGVDADALERECMKEPRGESSPLVLDDETRTRATRLLEGRQSPFIGVHVSGGREIKQWPPWRFAEVALELVNETNGTIVLTGVSSDRAMIDAVAARLPSARVVDVAVALDLPVLAALLERLDVVITGDTGPMHLAEAVGTPVVAVFGPSDPRRYGPRLASSRTVRIDLPCSPCNRIRRPPERCVGHTPDCLDGVGVGVVAAAAREVLTIARASRVSERTPRA